MFTRVAPVFGLPTLVNTKPLRKQQYAFGQPNISWPVRLSIGQCL